MEMFEPNLTLTREPDGEFTLHSATMTPQGCFLAGSAVIGLPRAVRLTEEVLPVMLNIKVQNSPLCLPAIKVVRHTLRDLKLGSIHNKTRLMAFAMLNDAVVGTSQIGAASFVPVASTAGVIETNDWFSWATETVHGMRSFHIIGTVVLPTPGFQVSFEDISPAGVNSKVFPVKLQVEAKPGIWPQHATSLHVHYDRAPYEERFTEVLVTLPSGDSVGFPVMDES